ncbi:MAG: hypothetical protein DRQ88_06500 [Epsilonproteobacteria bacterium]|nr:MAG: hypothetical protein DRQ89_04790 [Campylobacterota bacterium]RLA66447.1 MAG: hypothetical protein DRQ88_06500 [Campylobacterota bacterium]
MNNNPLILKLTPYLQEKVWGGHRLRPNHSTPIGESWEISIHSEGNSTVDGINLSQLINEKDLPYLVKIIDTSDNLSVQVHPGDEYAAKHENSKGKTECWAILDAGENQGIYLGLKDSITKKDFKDALEAGKNMSELLKFYPVKRGDFFYVPAGTPHAIGKDVLLAEVQQSSGITYRVWDWNRLGLDGKPRELHIEKALDVINFDKSLNTSENFKMRRGIFDQFGEIELLNHPEFNLTSFKMKKNQELELNLRYNRIGGLVCLGGELEVQRNGLVKKLRRMETLLIPLDPSEVKVTSKEDSEFLWIC